MKRLMLMVLVAAVALVLGGCPMYKMPDGTTVFPIQIMAAVRVQNDCAPFLDFERVSGPVVKGVPYGASTIVPMVSMPGSGNNRCMSLMAKGYTAERAYLGSMIREFCVDTYYGSRESFWPVQELRHPTGQNGCQM